MWHFSCLCNKIYLSIHFNVLPRIIDIREHPQKDNFTLFQVSLRWGMFLEQRLTSGWAESPACDWLAGWCGLVIGWLNRCSWPRCSYWLTMQKLTQALYHYIHEPKYNNNKKTYFFVWEIPCRKSPSMIKDLIEFLLSERNYFEEKNANYNYIF